MEKNNTKPVAEGQMTLDAHVNIYEKHTKDGNLIYEIVERIKNHPFGSQRNSFSMVGKIGEHLITPGEALALYQGDDIKINLNTKNGPAEAFVGIKELTTRTNEVDGKVYENRYLNLGIAFPKYKRDTQELMGYTIDSTTYFRNASVNGNADQSVDLSPSDCLKLSAGSWVNKSGFSVKQYEIKEKKLENGKTYRTAAIGVYPEERKQSNEENIGQSKGLAA